MNKYQRTAVSLAAAQAALLCSGLAMAQTAAAPATAASAPAAKTENLETVVVSGRRAALQSAQKIKQNSDEIVDSIVADDIGKLPDRSVTEVLQRIVGVTIERTMARNDPEHYSVEGSGVNIRGLSYVRSEMNGRDTFSANGGRALNFEDVPPELMAGIDVYKNPSAEQIEGAVGGLVNLRTALPFDYQGFKGSVTVQEGYTRLNGKKKPSASGLLVNSWNTDLGRIGLLLNVASSKSATRSDFFQIEPYYPRTDAVVGQDPNTYLWVPKGAQWRTLEFERKRDGLYGAVQWKKDDIDSSLTYFRSKYRMQWDEQAIFAQTEPYKIRVTNGKFNDQGALISGTLTNNDGSLLNFNDDTRTATRNSKTEDFAWRVNWKANDRWSFVSDLQYVKASTRGLDSTVATGIGMQKEVIDLSGSTPSLTFDAADRAFLADPKNYYWAFTMEHLDRSEGTQKSWKGDARYRFEHPVLQDLRFGVRLTDREAKSSTNPSNYHWQAISQPWTAGGPAYLSDYPGGIQTNTFNNFFGGSVPTPPSVVFPSVAQAAGFPASYAVLHKYGADNCVAKLTAAGQSTAPCSQWPFAFTPEGLGSDIAQDIQNGSGNKQSEKTQAAFAQLRFGFDEWKLPLDGNVGVRVVRTQNNALGFTSFPGTDQAKLGLGGVPVPNIPAYQKLETFKNSYTDVLPSLNLKLQAASDLQFRFAAAKAIARPDFDRLQASTTLSQTISGTATTVSSVSQSGAGKGNPMLLPTRSTQEDLTAEWYFSRAGSLTVAAFHKDLKDIVINQTTTFRLPDVAGNLQPFSVTSPINGASGNLTGVELAFQTYFDKLPGWLSGFGVQANYTYVDSKSKLYNPVNSPYCSGGNTADNFGLNLNGCDTDGRQFGNLPLQGLSRKAFNLTLMYDQGPLSARLAYSWRSRYLQAINVNGTQGTDGLVTDPNSPNLGQRNVAWGLPVWAESYGQLDAGVSYKLFNDQLSLGLEAQNLNSARQRQLMQQHVGYMTRGLFYTGPRYVVTARYTF
ncbi:TonB-dependent receptor [Pelomonas aquatica]|uniref:TonB-dependent receptor n=1 Tax=Pelomonas aquatica TaxID=431058 RepID=A0ABU1ZIB1_9BURK|nr:TonB-dependent receptor [Pelomonas aquatica]MDR7299791.1 TonB-dependent receptor [Pelomonas aquatica]